MMAVLASLLLVQEERPLEIELSVTLWVPWVDGRLRFDERPNRGSGIDVEDDWGWNAPAVVPRLGAAVEGAADRASLAVEGFRFSGRETPEAPLRWNESSFAPGETIRSELTLVQVVADYRRKLLAEAWGDLWGGVRARYLRAHVEASAPSPGDDDDNLGAFVPEALFLGRARLGGGWALEAEAAGIAFSAFDLRARTFSTVLLASWSPSGTTTLRAGWRFERVDLVSTDRIQRNELDVFLQGPSFEMSLRF